MRMRRMRPVAQRVEHPAVEPGQLRPGRLGDLRHVRQIDEVVDAEAERLDAAVLHADRLEGDRAAWTRHLEPPLQRVQFQDRGIVAARGLHEGIAEARDQRVGGIGIGPDRQPRPAVEDHHAQVVDSVHVVGMGMGIDHAVEQPDTGVEQLRPQVRRGVDQHPRRRVPLDALHQQRAAEAVVAPVGRVAVAPMPAEPRHPARRAAAEDRRAQERHQAGSQAAALANRRSKFAVVCAAKTAASMSHRCATARTVSAV
jgi:hypothetical protein